MTLPFNVARCIGRGTGPSGHQLVMECVNCQRRTAPRAGVQSYTEPPKEHPCPMRIAPQEARDRD